MPGIKYVILAVLLLILVSLGSALFNLVSKKGSGERMARALTIRVSLSILLLLFLVFAASMGWIRPHSLLPVPVSG